MRSENFRDMYNILMYGNLDIQTNEKILQKMIYEVTKEQSSDIVDGEPINETRFVCDDMTIAEAEYIKRLGCLLQTSLISKKEIADKKRDIYKGLIQNGGGKKYDNLLSTWLISFRNLENMGHISGYDPDLLQETLIEEGRPEFVETYFEIYNNIDKNNTKKLDMPGSIVPNA